MVFGWLRKEKPEEKSAKEIIDLCRPNLKHFQGKRCAICGDKQLVLLSNDVGEKVCKTCLILGKKVH